MSRLRAALSERLAAFSLSATVPRLRAALSERLAAFSLRAAGEPPFEAVARIHAAHEALVSGGAAAVQEVQDALAGGLPAEAAADTLFLALTVLILDERYEIALLGLDAGLETGRARRPRRAAEHHPRAARGDRAGARRTRRRPCCPGARCAARRMPPCSRWAAARSSGRRSSSS